MVRILFGIAILFSIASVVTAEESGSEIMDFWKCASPTNGFWGLNDSLADYGIEVGFSINNIYQVNIQVVPARIIARADMPAAMNLKY